MLSKFIITLVAICMLSFIAGYLPIALTREAEFNRHNMRNHLNENDRRNIISCNESALSIQRERFYMEEK